MAKKQWKLDKGLLVSVMNGDSEGAERFLRDGANPNQVVRAKNGTSPLLCQAVCLTPDLLDLFIEKGAHVDVATLDGETPLHMAVEPEQVERLLAAGASPTARSACGETPLHVVLTREAAQLLVDKGADPHAKCDQGLLPWQSLDLMASKMVATSTKVASRADVEAAAKWLRSQVEGAALDDASPAVQMTESESTQKAKGKRF